MLDFFYQNELDVLEHKVGFQKQKMRIQHNLGGETRNIFDFYAEISQRIKSKTAELATLREEMENIENEKRGVENQFTQVQERLFSLIPNLVLCLLFNLLFFSLIFCLFSYLIYLL